MGFDLSDLGLTRDAGDGPQTVSMAEIAQLSTLNDTTFFLGNLSSLTGPDFTLANDGGTTLFRMHRDGEREAIPVDIASIRRGKADDFLIQEDDVIVVPVSGPKYFMDRVLGLVRVGVGLKP